MTWILASALAAGITGDVRVGMAALFFFVRLALRREVSKGEGALVACAAVVFFAYGYASIAAARKDVASVGAVAARSEGPMELEGWVCGFPHWRYAGAAFEFRTRVEGIEHTVFVQSKEFAVCYGDSLRIRGTWRSPVDQSADRWATRYMAMGVSGEFRALAGWVERLEGVGGSWITRRMLFPCHDRVRRELCRGLGSRSGIPVALLIGERGYIDRRASGAFRALGISHLLALSGLHLGFVAGALVLLLRLFRRRAEGVLLAALLLYVSVVGPIISLYRAFVMAAVLIFGALVKRPLSPMTALVHAFIVVLLAFPNSFYSVAFQLSFMATFAVLCSVRSLRSAGARTVAGRVRFWVRSSLQVSVAAQLLVTPVVIHYFGCVSLLSPLATLVFVLPVACVLFFSGLSAVVAVAVPAAAPFVFAGLDRAATCFQSALVSAAAVLPGVVQPGEPDAWLYYGGLVLFAVARGRWALRVAGLLVVAFSFVVGAGP